MPLTALEVQSISCPEDKKQIKKYDGNGLFLLVKVNKSKSWRVRYTYAGKEKLLTLGSYPDVSLKAARESTLRAKAMLLEGINPMDARKERKRVGGSDAREFGKVALEWWERQKDSWSPDHAARINRWLTQDTKSINNISVDQIDAGHITELMLTIEAANTPKKAPVILSIINRIYGYALAHRLTRINPAQGLSLRDILKPLPKVKHRAAIINPAELASLIKDIDENESGDFCTIEALKLIPRVFLRSIEIRFLKWEYIDFDARIIRIPDKEMKKERDHLVPLAKQVIEQLLHIKAFTDYSQFVFPNKNDSSKPMSKNVLTNRLRSLGYSADVMCAHGFRSTASTILHEQGKDHVMIEVQLAHLTGTSTSRAYNRSLHLAGRKVMMQEWADYLDKLKS
jgi:integrase